MKNIIVLTVLLMVWTSSFGQIRCIEIIKRFQPEPSQLLLDSLELTFDEHEIEQLKLEANMIFTCGVSSSDLKIINVTMNYIGSDIDPFRTTPDLNTGLIKKIEKFFERNLKVIADSVIDRKKIDEEIVECIFAVNINK